MMSLIADGKTLYSHDHRGTYSAVGEAASERIAKRIARDWRHGGDCGGFWFHVPTWGGWKAAVSWSGTCQAPAHRGARPELYENAAELAAALREGAL